MAERLAEGALSVRRRESKVDQLLMEGEITPQQWVVRVRQEISTKIARKYDPSKNLVPLSLPVRIV